MSFGGEIAPHAGITHRACNAFPRLSRPSKKKLQTAPEGDQLLHKYGSPPQPKPQPHSGTAAPFTAAPFTAPPVQANPQIPNLHMAGPITPNPEQVQTASVCRMNDIQIDEYVISFHYSLFITYFSFSFFLFFLALA